MCSLMGTLKDIVWVSFSSPLCAGSAHPILELEVWRISALGEKLRNRTSISLALAFKLLTCVRNGAREMKRPFEIMIN